MQQSKIYYLYNIPEVFVVQLDSNTELNLKRRSEVDCFQVYLHTRRVLQNIAPPLQWDQHTPIHPEQKLWLSSISSSPTKSYSLFFISSSLLYLLSLTVIVLVEGFEIFLSRLLKQYPGWFDLFTISRTSSNTDWIQALVL